MLNVVAIMGRLAADPQLKTTTSGKSVASFRIANDSGYKNADGSSQTNWLDVVAWGKTAEFVCKYFQKGSLIALDGRLQSRTYQDKNGQNRTVVEIVANNANFACAKNSLPSPVGEGGAAAPDEGQPYGSAPHPSAPRTKGEPDVSYSSGQNDDFALIEDEGDLPF